MSFAGEALHSRRIDPAAWRFGFDRLGDAGPSPALPGVRRLSTTDFDLKERVRAAVDILDVVGQGTEVRPQGRNFVVRCPFHNDRRPSLTINPERQSWKCWVCNVGGDIFSFVMQRDGVDFVTALRYLAEQAGIAIGDFKGAKKTSAGDPDDRATLLAAVEAVTQAYFLELESGTSDDARLAREYLAARGIDDQNRKRFRIGFAPASWSFAVDLLARRNFSGDVAVAAGVALPRRSGDGHVDRFRGRLMFPIHDLQHRVISMGGRVIPAIARRAPEDHPEPKYINGPETLLFRKSHQLYGLSIAREAIRHDGQALVMEGYTDVVAARQMGIEPVVAVLGTALGSQHVKILKRLASRVVLVLDGDDAGRKRADEVLELFVAENLDLRVLTLPDDSDPADFLNTHGRDAFDRLVASAPDALDHKLAKLTDGVDLIADTHRATAAIEAMLAIMAKAPVDAGLRTDQMIVRLSDRFGMTADRLTRRLDAIRHQLQTQPKRPAHAAGGPAHPAPPIGKPTAAFQRPQNRVAVDPNDLLMQSADEASPMDFDGDFRQGHAGGGSIGRPSQRITPISGIDRELFETLIQSPELAAMAIESIDPDWLSGSAAKMLLSAYQDLDLAGRDLDVDSLLLMLENEQLKSIVVTLEERVRQRSSQVTDDIDARYTAIITRYREREFAIEKDRQIQRLQDATLDDEDELKLLQELLDAERFRQGIRPATLNPDP